jgi:hypothetical protein
MLKRLTGRINLVIVTPSWERQQLREIAAQPGRFSRQKHLTGLKAGGLRQQPG